MLLFFAFTEAVFHILGYPAIGAGAWIASALVAFFSGSLLYLWRTEGNEKEQAWLRAR
jgi:hypothetical protein